MVGSSSDKTSTLFVLLSQGDEELTMNLTEQLSSNLVDEDDFINGCQAGNPVFDPVLAWSHIVSS
jgi:hypothetical protein